MNDAKWHFIKEHLGYNDEELELFLGNPNNIEVLSKAPDLMKKTIVAEVVASHGCNSQHKVGDKFYFDGAGNLITKLSPKRICIHALSALSGPIYVANELFYAGVDPRIKVGRERDANHGLVLWLDEPACQFYTDAAAGRVPNHIGYVLNRPNRRGARFVFPVVWTGGDLFPSGLATTIRKVKWHAEDGHNKELLRIRYLFPKCRLCRC